MQGLPKDKNQAGIMPRSLDLIFEAIAGCTTDEEFTLTARYRGLSVPVKACPKGSMQHRDV